MTGPTRAPSISNGFAFAKWHYAESCKFLKMAHEEGLEKVAARLLRDVQRDEEVLRQWMGDGRFEAFKREVHGNA